MEQEIGNEFWKDKVIVVTGGEGFLGSYLVNRLKEKGPKEIIIPKHSEYDFTKLEDCDRITKNIDMIFHLAAKVGGIGLNQKKPGELFYDNLIMGTQLMESARKNKVDKFVALGTVCAYPKFTPIPFKEEDLWNGYPEETNAPYGLAKKMMLVQSQAYRKQYEFNSIFLLPVNLYGPRDNFNIESSHVIPALIRKIYLAKQKDIDLEVWGTGNASREFLYVDDAAEGILLASEKYNCSKPINLGSNEDISIKNLVDMLCKLMNFKGKIIWDSSKPDGQPKRKLNTSKAKEFFNFEAKTSLRKGLEKTIEWFNNFYSPYLREL